jgi:uncharacterized protein with PIN domain
MAKKKKAKQQKAKKEKELSFWERFSIKPTKKEEERWYFNKIAWCPECSNFLISKKKWKSDKVNGKNYKTMRTVYYCSACKKSFVLIPERLINALGKAVKNFEGRID